MNLLRNPSTYGLVITPTLTIPRKQNDKETNFYIQVTNTNHEKLEIENIKNFGTLEDISSQNQWTMEEEEFRTLTNHIYLKWNKKN